MSRDSKEIWTAFVMIDDGTWLQPSFYVPGSVLESANPDSDISAALLRQYGRKAFTVLGIEADRQCPEDRCVRELDW